MGNKIQSRILIPDRNGHFRKIAGVQIQKNDSGLDIYFFFPKEFRALLSWGKAKDQKQFSEEESFRQCPKFFKHIHLRYPPSGKCHFALKDSQGETLFYKDIQHERLSNLTTAKRILSIIPTDYNCNDHYPLYKSGYNELDWKINYSVLSHLFMGQPVNLDFWLGKGNDNELLKKAESIRYFTVRETRSYVEVLSGENVELGLQLFLTISPLRDVDQFPTSMRLILHPGCSSILKKKL